MPLVRVEFTISYTESDDESRVESYENEHNYDVRTEFFYNGAGGRPHIFDLGSMDTANVVVVRSNVNGGSLFLDNELVGHVLNPWGVFIGADCAFSKIALMHPLTAIVKEWAWGFIAGTDIIVDNLDNPVVDNLGIQVVR
jgi:hypothetical protein